MKRFSLLSVVLVVTTGLAVIGVSTEAGAHTAVPKVTSVTPNHGPLGGGTIVNINGAHLVSVTAVHFGSTAASFVPRSQHRVQAVAPAGTGTVDIEVTTSAGTTAPVATDKFSYVTTAAIQSLRPKIGSATGGNQVTISGSGFSGVTAVDFGSTPATSFIVDSPNAITAISPAHGVGTVDVTVSTAGGPTPTDPADQFTYVQRVPVVTSVVFDVGNQAGNDVVTITGARFLAGAAVYFGSTPALSVTVKSSSTILATSPPGTGTVQITVDTSKGASVLNAPVDKYLYTATGP